MINDIDILAIVITPCESFHYFHRHDYLWARIKGRSSTSPFDYGMSTRNLKQELETHVREGHEVITGNVEINKYLMMQELLK